MKVPPVVSEVAGTNEPSSGCIRAFFSSFSSYLFEVTMKVFHSITLFEVVTTCFVRRRKIKAEFPSVDQMSECMWQRRTTPHKGKARASSLEPIVSDDTPSATPLLVVRASTFRPPKRKREDEEWRFALAVLQGPIPPGKSSCYFPYWLSLDDQS